MSDRITTTCQHTHTVTLRLDDGEWYAYGGWVHTVRSTSDIIGIPSCDTKTDRGGWALTPPPPIRAELEAALAAAEASCGDCGCADRLRAEAAKSWGATRQAVALEFAADFLDAAPDARGSDLSAEQPAPRVSDLTGVYQSTSEPKTTMDDWLAARHDDQEATDG